MGKYIEDAKELLTYVGGRTNISAVTHCMTRMRFVLADPAKAEVDNIEKMSIVKGTFTQAGQFQVIIGNEVIISDTNVNSCNTALTIINIIRNTTTFITFTANVFAVSYTISFCVFVTASSTYFCK